MRQILIGGEETTNIVAGSTQYNVIQGWGGWVATDTVYQIMPTGGILDMLALRPSASPGQNATLTLMVNNNPTTLTCTTNSATIAHDNVNRIAVSAGDRVSVKLVIAASATTRNYSYDMRFTPNIPNESIALGFAASPSATLFESGFENSQPWQSTGQSRGLHLIPETGTFKKMYVEVDTDPGAGNTVIFTTRNNGANGNLTVTITGGGALTGNDTTHTDAIATAGNLYGLRITSTGTPTYSNVHYGVVYLSPTQGNYIYTFNSNTGGFTPGRPVPISGTRGTNGSNYRGSVSGAFLLKNMYAWFSVAPGAGTSRTTTLQIGGVNTALAVTVADAATTGNSTTDVTVAVDNITQLDPTVSGSPAVTAWKISMVAYLNDNPASNFFFMM